MMARVEADRSLLFGLLALQNNFIGRDELVAAFGAWVTLRDRPIGRLLVERGVLSEEDNALLESLVARHLERFGHDTEKSLLAVGTSPQVRHDLEDLADRDLTRSLALVTVAGDDPFATQAATIGQMTSSGSRFVILRPHARGGLGEVYVALDSELNRHVALKEIRPAHADDPDSRARFLLEAEITGGLEHPGIVPVHGLGSYPDGRPYYAMRFIRGETLEQAIAHYHATSKDRPNGERALEFRRLLGQFLDVCNAIEYAHSRGVLHRDLKPANVMLGKYGETLVVDWGLAKALEYPDAAQGDAEPTLRPATGSSSSATMDGVAIGTPSYMSPEQAEGRLDQLSPASDVYGLGATLYAVLTGRSPIEGQKLTEVLERVRRGEFPRPRQINPEVPAALEAICLKAMALRQQDRYPSARSLAVDIEHWLADEPVAAYPEPWPARTARWARRHRSTVSAVGALLITAVVALTIGLWRIGQEKARADERARIARERYDLARVAFDMLVFDVQEQLADKPATQAIRAKLLRTALRGLEVLVRNPESAASVDQSVFSAHIQSGDLALELGDASAARSHYEHGRVLADDLVRADPDDVEARRALSIAHERLGNLERGLGHLEDARSQYEKDLELREALNRLRPEDPEIRRDLAVAHNKQGDLAMQLGDLATANAHFQEGLLLSESLARSAGSEAQARRDLLVAHENLGDLSLQRGDVTAARSHFRESFTLARALASSEPDNPRAQRDLAVAYNRTGSLALQVGDLNAARGAYEKGLEITAALSSADPENVLARRDLAIAQDRLGDIHLQLGDLEAARKHFREGLLISEAQMRADPENATIRRDMSVSHNKLGDIALRLGDAVTARDHYRRGLELSEALAKVDPDSVQTRRDLSISIKKLGDTNLDLGALNEAAEQYRQCLSMRQALATDEPEDVQARIDVMVTDFSLGLLEQKRFQFEDAREWFVQARDLLDALREEGKLKDRPQFDDWRKEFEREIALCDSVIQGISDRDFAYSRPPGELVDVLCGRGVGLARRGEIEEGEAALTRLLQLAPDLPNVLRQVAGCFAELSIRAKDDADRERLSAQAVSTLRAASDHGAFSNPSERAWLTSSDVLAPLREREDFRALLANLPATPGPGEKP